MYTTKKRFVLSLLTIISTLLFAGVATASDSPYTKANSSWITLDGKVKAVQPDSFTLDYGDGWVVVEMDDGDRDADGYKLIEGDEVRVRGAVDRDFFETTTIEAASVYVKKIETTFFASAVDEEDRFFWGLPDMLTSQTVLSGTVKEVRDEEFDLDTGWQVITVEVEDMTYNPLDEKGYQRIDAGDYVTVSGSMDRDFFEGRELVASWVTTLSDE